MRGRSRARIVRWVELASLWEACAPKPGNVNRRFDFHDATLPDFLSSAVVTAESLRGTRRWSVGSLVHRAVRARVAVVGSNTNLGILLLLAPLAMAASSGPRGTLRARTAETLRSMDGEDARLVYEAIRLAAPGGLGRVDRDDVAEEAPPSLLDAMKEAALRDSVAREYGTDFALTFDLVVPELHKGLEAGLGLADAVVRAYLVVLASVPDTLISRKEGIERARDVSRRAAELLETASKGLFIAPSGLERFDGELRAFGNRLNPGTTADLTTAGLFVLLAEGPWSEAELLARWKEASAGPRLPVTVAFPGAEGIRRRTVFRLPRRRGIELGGRTLLMGVVNVTPDSFFEGSRVNCVDAAVARARDMIDDGADLVDIGAQSTRPGASEISEEEEKRRLIDVVAAVRSSLPEAVLSVDTSRASVAQEAIRSGADLINDVTALADPDMASVIAAAGVPVVLMHMKGTPRTMREEVRCDDLLGEVIAFLTDRVDVAVRSGIPRDRILLDPGIGFGKRRVHNLTLLREIGRLMELGFPLLIGHSRKAFLDPAGEGSPDPAERLEETLAVTAFCAERGVEILRVHDIASNRRLLRTLEAVRRGV